MFCKWCGLESETSDVCSWCRRPFSATIPAPPASELAAAADTPPTDRPPPQILSSPPPAVTSPISSPLVDYDDLDDDFSPVPFGAGSVRPAAPAAPPSQGYSIPAQPAPPVRRSDPALPRASQPDVPAAPLMSAPATPTPPPTTQPPAPAPLPISPGRGGPGYTPAPPRHPGDDRPQLEAIPIKRTGPPAGQSVPVIPIVRPPVVPPAPPAAGATAPPAGGRELSVGPTPIAPIQPPTQYPSTAPPPVNRTADVPLRPEPVPLGDAAQLEPEPPAAGGQAPVELGLAPLAEPEPDDFAPPPAVVRRPFEVGAAPAQIRPSVPPPGRTATLPPVGGVGGRTYYCRWCGMESDTPDSCSWCRRDLRNMPSAGVRGPGIVTSKHGPASKRGPIRQPTRPAPAPAKTAPANNGAPGAPAARTASPAVPQMGTFTAQKSKYYSDKVMDPVSGAHYDADTGKTVEQEVEPTEIEEIDLPRQLVINITFLVVLAGIAAVIAHASPSLYLVLLGVSNLGAGMMMPLLRTVPFAEDDSGDLGWFLGLTLILGPFVGGITYAFVGMARGGDWNPGIVGLYISYLVLRFALDIGSGHLFVAGTSRLAIMPFSSFDGVTIAAQAMIFLTLAGWYAAYIFHKPDES